MDTTCSPARLMAITKNCRNRGGVCDCQTSCKAAMLATEMICSLEQQCNKIINKLSILFIVTSKSLVLNTLIEGVRQKVNTPSAESRDGFTFQTSLIPVMVFDGDEVYFGCEDKEGEWIESDECPFKEKFIWTEDCEWFGIRME